MNKLKTFLDSLKNSLIQPEYYQDVEKSDFWTSFRYLWFLLFILIFIKGLTLGALYFKSRPYIKPEMDKIMSYTQNFYPKNLELKIQNGQLSTNVKEPYVLNLKNMDRHFLVIDTKGSIDNYPKYDTYVLATKNAVVYPSKSENNKVGQTSVFYFSDMGKQNLSLNEKIYNDFLNSVKPYTHKITSIADTLVALLIPFFLVFGSFFWLIGIMIGLVFLTFCVWIINLIFKKGHNYGSLYKMGMHAVTWPILFSEAVGYIQSPLPRLYSWIFFIWMMIVLFSDEKKVFTVEKPSKKRKS